MAQYSYISNSSIYHVSHCIEVISIRPISHLLLPEKVMYLQETEKTQSDHHTTTQAKNEMQSTLLLNIVVAHGSLILKLFSSKDETLLIRWNTFFILDFALDVCNRIIALYLKC